MLNKNNKETKLMKKILAAILALVMIFALAACGKTAPAPAAEPAPAPAEAPAAEPEVTETITEVPNNGETASEGLVVNEDLSGTVVFYSTQQDSDHETFESVFHKYYPNVEIEYVSDSIGSLVARVKAEGENPQGDIIFGGLSQSDGDQYFEVLEPYTAKFAAESVVPSNGYYTWFTYQYVCLIENTELMEELGIEVNGYADLLQPELKGKIIQAAPDASSSAWRQLQTMLATMGDEFGDEKAWDFCKALIENSDGIVTTSSSTVYKSVYNGEYAIGITYADGAANIIKNGADNCKMIFMEEGDTVCGFASAMIKNCPHPELAKAVLDVMSSSEFQAALNTNYYYCGDTNLLPDNINDILVPLDFEYLSAEKANIIDKWNDIWTEVNG